ncbi:hypothetical protein [Pseudomonas paeninsulae]|uniref:hypothetical protein n=1 Tax=Pseudomonas paeninsulae TaxID=3110772 RepID=UPI002D791BD9|nr:hypothetical protein [Pseudomonas sp. IT1137]
MAKIKEQIPAGAVGLSVELGGYAFIVGGPDGIKMKNVMPINIEYQAPNKKGDMKTKKQTMNLTGNYCMLCGEKYPANDSA